MKKILILLGVGLLPLLTKAQSASLNQLINGIIANSSALKSQKSLLKIGEVKTQIQESFNQPIIGADLGVTRIDPVAKANFNGLSLQFQPNMNYTTGFSANHVIYDWGKNAMAIEKTRLETAVTQAQIESQEANLAYQITQLYYQYQLLSQSLQVQKNQQKRLQEQLDIINQQVLSGTNLEYEKVAQAVRVQSHAAKLVETENQLLDLKDYLSTLLGADASNLLAATNIQVDKNYLKEQTTGNNLDLQQLSAQELLAKKETDLAKGGNLPTISGIASLGVRNGYVPRINGETPPFSEDFKVNSVLGIKLNIPIYSGKRTELQSQISKLNEERLQYQKADIEKRISYNERSARKNLSSVVKQLEAQEKSIEQAKYALNLASERYKQGFIKKIELDQAENMLEEAQLLFVQYQYQAKKQEIELRKIIGETFWK